MTRRGFPRLVKLKSHLDPVGRGTLDEVVKWKERVNEDGLNQINKRRLIKMSKIIRYFIKGIKNPRKAVDYILDKLMLTEKSRVGERGERLVLRKWEDWEKTKDFVTLAHIQRYEWVSPYVKNLYVLDAGCGTGYGVYYLASSGVKYIIGIDKSSKAINFAKKYFQKENLEFKIMNVCKMEFRNNTFDAVISFDVLEHLSSIDQEKFIAETVRVLKPEGILYIGCPNATVSKGNNPHHLKELTKKEFQTLLQEYYKDVKILGQDLIVNGVRQKEHWHKNLSNLSKQNFIIVEEDIDFVYGLLAICKNKKT